MIVRKLILISAVALGLTGCFNSTENQKPVLSSPVFKKVSSSQSQITFNNVVDENYRHNYFDTFAARVSAVELEEVRDVASRHLNPGKMATAIVADAATAGPQLTRAGLGEPVPLLPRL